MRLNSKTSVETLTKYLHTLDTHNRFPALSALRGDQRCHRAAPADTAFSAR